MDARHTGERSHCGRQAPETGFLDTSPLNSGLLEAERHCGAQEYVSEHLSEEIVVQC